MDTKQLSPALVTKTCQACRLSVTQQPGTRRTLCPGCGAFYDADLARQVRQTQNIQLRKATGEDLRERYEKLHREQQKPAELSGSKEQAHSNGPLQSIASFFTKLGGKKKNLEEPDRKKKDEFELPDIDTQGRLTTSRSSGNKSPRSPKPNDGAETKPVLQRILTCDQLKQLYCTAKEQDDWKELSALYSTIFESYSDMSAVFKKVEQEDLPSTEDSGIRFDLVEMIYEVLKKVPGDVQKAVLKAIINSLMKDKRLTDQTQQWSRSKDELRCYVILSMNPLFQNPTTFVIFAHLLRQIAALSDHDHHFMVHWYKSLSVSQFTSLVHKLNKFVSLRLFPTHPQELPPMSKCHWWIPSCCKLLALLNAANNLSQPPIMSHTGFYNDTLDNIDLFAEYNTWQNPTRGGGFSFCQYPFLLTIAAKRFIMQKDSEQQMISQARQTLVNQVRQHQAPEIEALFLNLNVRRTQLVADSLNEIAKNKNDLKKKLKVTFVGEPGLDLGGLTKEWFLLLIRELFQPEYRMFVFDKAAGSYWFCLENKDKKQKEFNLIGVLMGLAVYNGINLDVKLPFVAYKKLLSPAVVPQDIPGASVGVLPSPSIEDLGSIFPEVANSLSELLHYPGNVEEDLCLSFEASIGQYGQAYTEQLAPDGSKKAVTKENRHEYVSLYLDWVINKSVYAPFRAFYHGFHSVCASNALLTLKPVEVEVLVNGCPDLNMEELRKVTQYDGYSPRDANIRDFWDLVTSMDTEGHKNLMRFVTGSDRIPASGMTDMEFKISRIDNPRMLPVAHTCFNQLVLPSYNNKKLMKSKLHMAMSNTEGFGLE